MTPRVHSICIVILATLVAGNGTAQDEAHKRFLAVECWVGTVNVVHETTRTSGGATGGAFEVVDERAAYSSQTKLKFPIQSKNGWKWKQDSSGDTSQDSVSATASRSDFRQSAWRRQSVECRASGTSQPFSGILQVKSPKNEASWTYSFDFMANVSGGSSTWTKQELDAGPGEAVPSWKTRVTNQEWGYGGVGAHISDEPLPEDGMTLSGSRTVTKTTKTGGTFNVLTTVRTTTTSWHIVPENLVVPEVIVTIPRYDDWIPEGATSELAPGNDLLVSARLQNRDGEPLKLKARKFVFELLDVSREPGVAMNYPDTELLASRKDPDLQFDLEANDEAGLEVTLSGKFNQRAEVGQEGLTEATVILSAFDWGAYGVIRVSAELEDGTTVQGRLETDPSRMLILLPKRQDWSSIADAWKEEVGVTESHDGDDADAEPEGDGHTGDGLALYEEYRGFFASKQHTRTHPQRKDFFVLDLIRGRARHGIAMFAGASGLDVHVLHEGEMNQDTRIINPNQSGPPRVVEQHGIILNKDTSSPWGSARARGGPSTPGNITMVTVPLSSFDSGPNGLNVVRKGKRKILTDNFAASIAHELLHCCNVYHHGEDFFVKRQWRAGRSEGIDVIFEATSFDDDFEEPRVVHVHSENGSEIASNRFPQTTIVYIGTLQGTHSGFEDCLMRYDYANAYVARDEPSGRYWFQTGEMTGIGLCDQLQGTGVNHPSREPQPRYGDANADRSRGFCKQQICVNDVHDHPQGERL